MKKLTALIAFIVITLPTVALAEAVQQPAGRPSGQAAPGGGLVQTLMFILPIIFIFWFLIIRPEKKRKQEHIRMIAEIEKGDKIVTIGGIYGRVIERKDDKLTLEISDGVRIRMTPDSVLRVLDEGKGE